jgi:hypothetical protein
MTDTVRLTVNGRALTVPAGATVAVALAIAGDACRTSVSGEPRAALCAMGICFECRATVNGALHQRTCQIVCGDGMEVRTE